MIFITACEVNVDETIKKNIPKKEEKIQEISFLFTGELLSELEPCGCSKVKIGGMVNRSAWITHIRKTHPHLYLIDGGYSPHKNTKQDVIKAKYHQKMLSEMGYHYQVLDRKKEKIHHKKLKQHFINCRKDNFYAVKKVSGIKILLFHFTAETREALKTTIKVVSPHIILLLTRGIYFQYKNLIPQGAYFSIILPLDAQEPFGPLKISPEIKVLSSGNKGRSCALVHMKIKKKRVLSFKSRIIKLTEKHQPKKEIKNLLENYKKEVKKAGLLELQVKKISPIGFVGSESCIECHEDEHLKWKDFGHAKAFSTLVKENYHYDPECVRCHVVGFEYEEGFRTLEESDYLINVGCESCHGPGAKHITNPEEGNYGKTKGKETCLKCHTKDHSSFFDYAKYLKKIKHWED